MFKKAKALLRKAAKNRTVQILAVAAVVVSFAQYPDDHEFGSSK
jgi:AmiR/NasT family two-component response regulator